MIKYKIAAMSNARGKTKSVVNKMCVVMMLASLPEILGYYAAEGVVSFAAVRLAVLLSFSILWSVSFKNIHLPGRNAFMLIFLWMYFVSFFNLTPQMPYLTLLAISALMVGGVLSDSFPLQVISKSFSALAVLYMVILLWQLQKTNLDLTTILRRGYTWTELFAYATLTSIWPICLFSSFLLRKKMSIAVGITLMAVIVNSLFLKRAIYVELFLGIAILLYVSNKMKGGKAKSTILFMIVSIVFAFLYLRSSSIGGEAGEISNAIYNRFAESSEDISDFDRLLETKNYLTKEASIFDVLFGRGFLSAHHALSEELYFLHVGWTNLIFKGGILFFIAFLVANLKAFKIIRHPNRYSQETLFSAIFSVFNFGRFFFSNEAGFGPSLFFIFYCLMQVNNPIPNDKHSE